MQRLPELLEPDESAVLLIALLVHDIGMLSQNPSDLPSDATPSQSKALWSDVATWVRQTHVARLERLVRRLLTADEYRNLLSSAIFQKAIDVAKSHQRWPWEWDGLWSGNNRYRGLAAILAIADLLDEDSARCDTITLLEHREGNLANRAHWLRHALTANRVLVERGAISVEMVRPPGTGPALRPVYSALRNHFRLVALYEKDLQALGAPIININLKPSTGLPFHEITSLTGWEKVSGFGTQNAFCYQLLRTFMSLALKDTRTMQAAALAALPAASLEDVDIDILRRCEGKEEPGTEFERTFAALAGGSN